MDHGLVGRQIRQLGVSDLIVLKNTVQLTVCVSVTRRVVIGFENGLAHEFPLHAEFHLIQPKGLEFLHPLLLPRLMFLFEQQYWREGLETNQF